MLRRTCILILLGMTAMATPARAGVLVSRPASVVACGSAIESGVWYRGFPGRGDRRITIEVRAASGAPLDRRRVTATGRWRYFRYRPPRCGRHYRVRYVTAAGVTDFRVWVREG